ncbi:MAG TPA: hypothetical protein DD618_03830 [Acholeplasmatales bacterium]|nr:hypothetical protein [Acholeplasmatales bacterium]
MKKISIAIMLFLVMILAGCGSSGSPERLWNRYVAAMNAHDLEKVAAVYYAADSLEYNQFLETNPAEVYFADFDSIKTRSFEAVIVNKNYYAANIVIGLTLGSETTRKEFVVYYYKDTNYGWKFTGEINATAYDMALLGNQPDANFYANVVKTADGFDYKYIYGGLTGEVSDQDYVKIVAPISNSANVVIPESIEGVPVKVIGDFAFFDYFRLLSITLPTSKLETIEFPNTLTTIEQYAFYQAKNLKSLTFPESLKEVGKYAFASCTNMETLTINVDESAMYAPENLLYLNSRDSMFLNANRRVYMEDTIFMSASGASVDWSTDDPAVATIESNGKLTLVAPGTVTVRATNKDDVTLYSEADITILPKADKTITSTTTVEIYRYTIKRDWYIGDTQTLNVTSENVAWSTSDPNIATIDANGKVTAVGTGTVTITADSTTSEVTSTATVTVLPAADRNVITTYSYTPIEFTGARKMYVADLIELTTTGFDLGEILWTSSNSAVATVSMYEGVVQALAKGNAIITATSTENPNIFSTVNINVAEVTAAITFAENSLDRLNSLKELYVNAINPYSVAWKGTLHLPDTCKIYVPAQNYETYLIIWSDFADLDMIYVIPE